MLIAIPLYQLLTSHFVDDGVDVDVDVDDNDDDPLILRLLLYPLLLLLLLYLYPSLLHIRHNVTNKTTILLLFIVILML